MQTNAARLDVDAYLTAPGRATVVWGCGAYAARIEPGDRAFLWRAAGGTKALAGIVALATVARGAEFLGHDAPDACRDPRLLNPKLRVVLRLDEVRPAHPIPRAAVKHHPEMARHPVVTANQGCAFALTQEQAEALEGLWRDFAPEPLALLAAAAEQGEGAEA